jgi:hypothetical protein
MLSFAQWFEWASAYARAAGCDPQSCRYAVDDKGRILSPRGRVVCEKEQNGSFLAVAEWHIVGEWAEWLASRYLVCHSAALERHGGALLLVGLPGAGKSTLALALTRRGYSYLGEEFNIVCPDTFEALPFPKALCIKDTEMAVLTPPDPHFEIIAYPPDFAPRYEGAVCCLPHKEIVPAPGKRFPVRWVFFLHDRRATGPPIAVPRWRAAKALYDASWRAGDTAFRAAVGVARQAQLWDLERDSLDKMMDCIEGVTEH